MIRKVLNAFVFFLLSGYLFLWYEALEKYFQKPVISGIIYWILTIFAIVIGYRLFREKNHIPAVLLLTGLSGLFPFTIGLVLSKMSLLYYLSSSIFGLILIISASIVPSLIMAGGAIKLLSGNEFRPIFIFIGILTGMITVNIVFTYYGLLAAVITFVCINTGMALSSFPAKRFSTDIQKSSSPNIFRLKNFLIPAITVIYVYLLFRTLGTQFNGVRSFYLFIGMGLSFILVVKSFITKSPLATYITRLLSGGFFLLAIYLIPYLRKLYTFSSFEEMSSASKYLNYPFITFLFSILFSLPVFFLVLEFELPDRIPFSKIISYKNAVLITVTLLAVYFLYPLIGSLYLFISLFILLIISSIYNATFNTANGFIYRIPAAVIGIGLIVLIFFIPPQWSPQFVYRNIHQNNPVDRIVQFKEGKEHTSIAFIDKMNRARFSLDGLMETYKTGRNSLLTGLLPGFYLDSPDKVLSLDYTYPEDLRGILLSPDVGEIYQLVPPGSNYPEMLKEESDFKQKTVFSDDRIELIESTPRAYLTDNTQNFDLIVNAPLEPGSKPDNHYTDEFLKLARKNMTDKSILVQKINTLYFTHKQLQKTIETFASNFNQTSLWSFSPKYIIVLASTFPVRTDYNEFNRARRIPGTPINKALTKVNLGEPLQIIKWFRGFERDMFRTTGKYHGIYTDYKPLKHLNRKNLAHKDAKLSWEMTDFDSKKLSIYGILKPISKNRSLVSRVLGLLTNMKNGWGVKFAGFEFLKNKKNKGKSNGNQNKEMIWKYTIQNSDGTKQLETALHSPREFKDLEDAVQTGAPVEESRFKEWFQSNMNGHKLVSVWAEGKNHNDLTATWVCDENKTLYISILHTHTGSAKKAGKTLISRIRCLHTKDTRTENNPQKE